MRIVVFGATGPTGLAVCQQGLARGHQVRAVTRREGAFPVAGVEAFKADVLGTENLAPAVQGCDAVLSTLGTAYSRQPITIYSVGTKRIVEAMRATGVRRLVVVSSGLTYPAPHPIGGVLFRLVAIPLLREVLGKTLYADMRRMEELLQTTADVDWSVLRPARLVDGDGQVSRYRLTEGFPTQHTTTRADLAAAMLDELGTAAHLRQAWAPTTK